MDTNFQMLRTFRYEPEAFGFCTAKEVRQIKNHFKIEERSNMELQNLRDFVVMYYDFIRNEMSTHDAILALSDAMSAITGVIDNEKCNRGMEV